MCLKSKRLCLSLTTWFSVPDKGMKSLEILNRGSAFIVPNPNRKSIKNQLAIVSCSHVIAPWKWPAYYPNEWLKHVNESHVNYSLEIRNQDGMLDYQIDLSNKVFHHKYLDVSVLLFRDEDTVTKICNESGVEALHIDTDDISIGQKFLLKGHALTGTIDPDGKDYRYQIPYDANGTLKFKTPPEIIFKSLESSEMIEGAEENLGLADRIIEDGMSGGPVLVPQATPGMKQRAVVNNISDDDDCPIEVSREYVCKGMLDALYLEHRLGSNLVSVISSKEILNFLNSI